MSENLREIFLTHTVVAITAVICTVPPTVLDGSASQAKMLMCV